MADATKLSKKLNGAILKGTKIKIETARPKTEVVPEPPVPEKPKREKKKRKRDEIAGVEIDRSVKRGWTTPGKIQKGDKKKVKSKYTEGKECLFKTVLPSTGNGKDKERKVVHEFAKREKYATFLRGPAGEQIGKGVKEFIDGKGWVDEDGEVVEVVVKRVRKRTAPEAELSSDANAKKAKAEKDMPAPDSSSDPSSEESSDEEIDDGLSAHDVVEAVEQVAPDVARIEAETSTSGSSSESGSDSDSSSSEDESEEDSPVLPSPTVSTPATSARPASSSGLVISIPNSAGSSTAVHPLEALYKKPKGDSVKPPNPSFSFFGADDENDDIEMESQDIVPLTPFTQRDFEFRGQRSAAPTPDTAHANKRFLWPKPNNDGDEDDEAPSSPIRKDSKGKGKSAAKEVNEEPKEGETDFGKWFYENRGDTTRAWKKRRKVVAKEKRQRENRKRGERAG